MTRIREAGNTYDIQYIHDAVNKEMSATSTVSAWKRITKGTRPIQSLRSGASMKSRVKSWTWRKKSAPEIENLLTCIPEEVGTITSCVRESQSFVFCFFFIFSSTASALPLHPARKKKSKHHGDHFLTSGIGFEHECVSNEGIRSFQLRNGLHLKPLLQVAAEHLVGEVGQSGD